MQGILDSMMAKPQGFVPETVAQYEALQLARKLGDTDRIRKYVALFERVPSDVVAEAYRRASQKRQGALDVVRAFDDELKELTERGNNDEI